MAAPSRMFCKGLLEPSLISVPVRAFTANEAGGEVLLTQLHEGCSRRVKHRQVCPEHGDSKSENFVSGDDHQQDPCVVVDPSRLDPSRLDPSRLDELRTNTLIAAWKLAASDLDGYQDRSVTKLKRPIALKVHGNHVVQAKDRDEPKILTLMDALEKSVAEAQARLAGGDTAAPPRRGRTRTGGCAVGAEHGSQAALAQGRRVSPIATMPTRLRSRIVVTDFGGEPRCVGWPTGGAA